MLDEIDLIGRLIRTHSDGIRHMVTDIVDRDDRRMLLRLIRHDFKHIRMLMVLHPLPDTVRPLLTARIPPLLINRHRACIHRCRIPAEQLHCKFHRSRLQAFHILALDQIGIVYLIFRYFNCFH